MKKRIFKPQNLINLAVSFCLFIFLFFFLLKPEPIDPCDCVDLLYDKPARPVGSIKDWELSELKKQKNWTEEQFQKYLDCTQEFENYDKVNSLCNRE